MFFNHTMAESLNIRKSTKSDSRTILNVVNDAYKATVGDTGKAFKTCNRFANIDQVEKLLDIFWVGELGGKIVGVVGIEVIGDMVDIGPLAVSTKSGIIHLYQVSNDAKKYNRIGRCTVRKF